MRGSTFIALAVLAFPLAPAFGETITVRSGETLSEIAERHRVPLKRLMQENNLRNANQIWSGQQLTLPKQANRIQNQTNTSYQTNHFVKEGETIGMIASKYKVSPERLIKNNNLENSDYLYIGQKLAISYNSSNTSTKSTHKVKEGESLIGIARSYQLTPDTILRVNNLKDENFLYPGQELKLPYNASIIHPQKESLKIEEATFRGVHRVTNGETLSSISGTYNIPIETLIAINNISDPNTIIPGTKLRLNYKNKQKVDNLALKNKHKSPNKYSRAVKRSSMNRTWRKYGPLKVNWKEWKSMKGSYVTPTMNSQGKSLYIAVNCEFKKLNSTGKDGNWKNWFSPLDKFEKDLVRDLCLHKRRA
nr:LysM peptidoglycan-binding domain-containing protein [Prochlorococcus sp. MIT 1341]